MRVLIFLLISTTCFAQGPLVRGGDGAIWNIQKEYILKDGMVFKYIAGPDTARYFNRGTDGRVYELTVSVKDITPLPVLKMEAEHARIIERAALDTDTNGNTVCCVTGTPVNLTKLIFDGEKNTGNRKQIVIMYARGNTGKGKLTLSFAKEGYPVVSYNFYLDPTGDNTWVNWKEAVFDVPANLTGVMSITTDQLGAWNLDYVAFK
jgi:hypothetical protein